MQTSSASKFIKTNEWDTKANRYMQPKMSDRGLKSVNIISTQKNKKLSIQLPLLTTYGINDYTDQATGVSDGRFSINLFFPGDERATEEGMTALEKLKEFEQQVINDAVANSEAWFGKKQTREITEYGYFPFLKVGKNKDTKQPDPSRGHYFRPKVQCFNGKWEAEIFNTSKELIFPCEKPNFTPMDFIPEKSEVACGIECKSIWIGAKGWGLTWSLKQCIVIPNQQEYSSGQVQLEWTSTSAPVIPNAPTESKPIMEQIQPVLALKKPDVYQEDSDEELPLKELKPEIVMPEIQEDEVEEPPVVQPQVVTAPVKRKVARKA